MNLILARVNELSVDESSFTGEPVQKLKQVFILTGGYIDFTPT